MEKGGITGTIRLSVFMSSSGNVGSERRTVEWLKVQRNIMCNRCNKNIKKKKEKKQVNDKRGLLIETEGDEACPIPFSSSIFLASLVYQQ